MSNCDATNLQISLQVVTVVLGTISTIMLGVRCKCRGPCGEFNLRPRSSPLTPPEIPAKPQDGAQRQESQPLITATEKNNDVVINIRQ